MMISSLILSAALLGTPCNKVECQVAVPAVQVHVSTHSREATRGPVRRIVRCLKNIRARRAVRILNRQTRIQNRRAHRRGK